MKFKPQKKYFIIALIIVIALTVAFIWGNSMIPKKESAEGSGKIFGFIQPILDAVFGAGVITHDIFRKMAHFTEFSLLALEVVALLILIKKFNIFGAIIAMGGGLIVAVIDEVIQISSNRGASVVDVLIDFLGVLFITLISYLIFKLVLKKLNKNKQENN